jgi:putative cell wall-binding protein
VVLAVAALVGAPVWSGTAAASTASWNFTRLQGADRYATAAAVAHAAFPAGAPSVVVASGVSFADALAASYLAGVVGGPVLLTDPLALPSATSSEISALGARHVYVVGGMSAVSAHVQAQLAGLTAAGAHPVVSTLSGPTRYDTAEAIAEFATEGGVGVVDGKRTAFLASGTTFPDALAASPIANAARLPLMLTDPASLSPQVGATISHDQIQQVVILGGSAAVSAAVESAVKALGITTQRVAGADRTLTAATLAAWAIGHAGFATTGVAVARGDTAGGGVDALGLASLAARLREPMLLTASPTDAGSGTSGWFADNGSMLKAGDAAGGASALGDALLSGLSNAASSAGPAVSGTVWAWGFNGDGELGNGANPFDGSIHVPGRVANLTHVTAVAGGGQNAYALRSDGTVWQWGLATGGPASGVPSSLPVNDTPVQVPGLAGVTAVSASYNAGYALDASGQVWAWGLGALGQGTAGYQQSAVPVRVPGLPKITAIGGGTDDGYAIGADGSVWDWLGWNSTPTRLSVPSGVTEIVGDNEARTTLQSDGTVWTLSATPGAPAAEVQGLINVKAITAGGGTAYALRADGTVWAWGSNQAGALGDGSGVDGSSDTPVEVSGLTGITQIASFAVNAYALKSDGTVWAWGSYYAGALGNGTDAYTYPGVTGSDVPVEVTGLTGVTSIGNGAATGYAVIGQ